MRPKVIWLIPLMLAVILAACSVPPAPVAQSSPANEIIALTPVTACSSAVTATHIPLFYAFDEGLFEQNGLKVEIVDMDGGSNAAAALIAGDVDTCLLAGGAVVNAVAAGADVRLLAGIVNEDVYSLVVAPQIQTLDDLRGQALAVNTVGGSADTVLRSMLEISGLVPDDDVAILTIGNQSARLAALEAGNVAGTVVNPPFTAVAREMGFHVLLDMAELGIPFQHTTVSARGDFVDEGPEAAKAFVRTIGQAIQAMQNDEEGAKASLASHLQLDPVSDAALIDEAYDVVVKRYLNQDLQPTLEGIARIIEQAAIENPGAANLRPEDVVDMSVLNALDDEFNPGASIETSSHDVRNPDDDRRAGS
ncbi:MAG: ABC transporter substrate-binding protein [Caldilineales bacterium]|nr:ABC transporter substrate-binding protein [Caldilineales bacterium]